MVIIHRIERKAVKKRHKRIASFEQDNLPNEQTNERRGGGATTVTATAMDEMNDNNNNNMKEM